MSYVHGVDVGDHSDQYNDTIPFYELRPYGSSGGQIFFSFIFMVWIIIANIFLIFLIFKDITLRHQPHNIYVVFMCLFDLTNGLYYFPLNMDFLVRGHWDHGCSSLIVWIWLFVAQIGACTFTLFLLNFALMCRSCSCSPYSLKARFILHGLSCIPTVVYVLIPISLLGTNLSQRYPSTELDMVGLYSAGETISTQCDALSEFETVVRLTIILVAFWIPMYISLVFLAIALYRLTRFDSPKKVNLDMTQVSLKVLVLVTLVSVVLPGPFIMFLSLHLPAPCVFLLIQGPDFTCDGSVAGLYIFLQWVLLSKSGVLPLMWFAGEDYRKAAAPIIQRLRPLWKPLTMLKRSEKTTKYEPEEQKDNNQL